MAINNAEKRKSAASAGQVFMVPGVTPNSAQDEEWRYQSGWGYSGNLIGAVGADIRKHIIQAYMRINI